MLYTGWPSRMFCWGTLSQTTKPFWTYSQSRTLVTWQETQSDRLEPMMQHHGLSRREQLHLIATTLHTFSNRPLPSPPLSVSVSLSFCLSLSLFTKHCLAIWRGRGRKSKRAIITSAANWQWRFAKRFARQYKHGQASAEEVDGEMRCDGCYALVGVWASKGRLRQAHTGR